MIQNVHPRSWGQKGIGSRIRIRNTDIFCFFTNIMPCGKLGLPVYQRLRRGGEAVQDFNYQELICWVYVVMYQREEGLYSEEVFLADLTKIIRLADTLL
jgi:hypothetical protein